MNRVIIGPGVLATLAAVVGLSGLAPSAAQKSAAPKPISDRDAFFTDGKIPHLIVELDKKDADSLRREPRKYVKCVLKDGDKTYTDVGIHLRGAVGSFRGLDDKPGLTLNMDKFKDDQRYRGMDKFHLANSAQDPSYVSELICGELFRAAGVPAARVGFATVTVMGRKRGLYYVKEGYDRDFLKQHFKNSGGNLYDGGFLREIDQPLDLISTKKDVADRKDLKALFAAAQERDLQKRFQKLDKLLDMDVFVSYMVLEAIMSDWDGYPSKCNNYRIYHDPERDKITFIPSGMDQMFGDTGWPILPGWGGLVARAVVETPEGKKKYYARMREVMKSVFKPDDLVKRLNELEKQVRPALATVDPGAARDYKGQVDRLRDAVRQRAKNVEEQLKNVK